MSGAGEILIFVECREDLVVVYPSRKRVSVEALSHSPGHNPLLQAIRQQAARRMAAARPGDPAPRLHIRFLVHNRGGNGLRTFHMAYPVVEDLKGEKTRYDLDPLDDVARIVAGQ